MYKNDIRNGIYNIKQWFENDSDNYNVYEDDKILGIVTLYASTDTIVYHVTSPNKKHSKWELRITTRSAFDRWSNSTAIKKIFNTDVELCNYLNDNKLDIYKKLIKYLSLEYDEISY